MSDSRAAVLARLSTAYGMTYDRATVTVTRKSTDSHADTGADDYGTRKNTNANRRNGGRYPGFFKADTEYLAGADPATTRPSFDGRVKPGGGRKIGADRELAALESVNAGARAWVAERTNVVIAAGDDWPRMWPDGSQPGDY